MQECQPIPTIRAFMESPLTYVLPAPGGALADGGVRTNMDSDLYLASLAAKAKRRKGDDRSAVEYLQEHMAIVVKSVLFDLETDKKIIARVGGWIRELAS